jgi:hypothetical protein
MGLSPRRPANRRLQSVTANTVDKTDVVMARLGHLALRSARCEICRYHPRLSMSKVIISKGQLSARNAGAKANTDPEAPRSPSRPLATHHQGRGNRPLSIATKGVSIRRNFCTGHRLHLLGRTECIGLGAENTTVAI